MNSYQYQYVIKKLNQNFILDVEKTISEYSTYSKATTETNDDFARKSKVCFLKDSLEIYNPIWELVDDANSECFWNFDLDIIEPIQNTLYEVGDYYNWHIDESNWTPSKRENSGMRKISFTMLLNDNFDGGNFEMILEKKITIPMSKGDIIFFHSDTPHRVTEVTSGFRKSLVGWVQGPGFR